jgi:hypothetical protein
MSERLYELQAARSLYARQREQGLAALNSLFRSGTVSGPVSSGRYTGKFLAVHIAPGLTQLAESLAGIWMPWIGKTFNDAQQTGDNILTRTSYPLARIFNPLYRGFRPGDSGSYRAFAFRTYIAPGLMDADRTVLKIDYNLKENPALTVRRILDELVELEDRLYLGKAHVHWWWGRWQTVAYFTLTKQRIAP